MISRREKYEIAKELIAAQDEIVSARGRLTKIIAVLLPPNHPAYKAIEERRLALFADRAMGREEAGGDALFYRFDEQMSQLFQTPANESEQSQ